MRQMPKQAVQLGPLQETMPAPLYARALETVRKRPILNDPKAVEMVASIDWEFGRFGHPRLRPAQRDVRRVGEALPDVVELQPLRRAVERNRATRKE